MRQSIADLNRLSREDFVRVVGPVFEHSPWIATEAAGRRPFPSVDELHRAMCAVVRAAPPEKQLALVRAHPDLAGRAKLTAPSAREQAGAGLLKLAPGSGPPPTAERGLPGEIRISIRHLRPPEPEGSHCRGAGAAPGPFPGRGTSDRPGGNFQNRRPPPARSGPRLIYARHLDHACS